MKPNYSREFIDRLFDELHDSIAEVHAALLPKQNWSDPRHPVELQGTVQELTDVMHYTVHKVIDLLELSDTPGANLKFIGAFDD